MNLSFILMLRRILVNGTHVLYHRPTESETIFKLSYNPQLMKRWQNHRFDDLRGVLGHRNRHSFLQQTKTLAVVSVRLYVIVITD